MILRFIKFRSGTLRSNVKLYLFIIFDKIRTHYSIKMKLSFKELIFELKYVLLILVLIIFFIISLFTFTNKVCAKITDQSRINSCNTIVYTFKANNKYKTGIIDIGMIKDGIHFDSLQKLVCVEIEYSKLIPAINWINDERIMK